MSFSCSFIATGGRSDAWPF